MGPNMYFKVVKSLKLLPSLQLMPVQPLKQVLFGQRPSVELQDIPFRQLHIDEQFKPKCLVLHSLGDNKERKVADRMTERLHSLSFLLTF